MTSTIIQSISDFIADLLGCGELTGDEQIACYAKAKKYASWLIIIFIIVIILLVVPKIYGIIKKK